MVDQSNAQMHTFICLCFRKEMVIKWARVDTESILWVISRRTSISWILHLAWCASLFPAASRSIRSILLWFPVALLYWCAEPSERVSNEFFIIIDTGWIEAKVLGMCLIESERAQMSRRVRVAEPLGGERIGLMELSGRVHLAADVGATPVAHGADVMDPHPGEQPLPA